MLDKFVNVSFNLLIPQAMEIVLLTLYALLSTAVKTYDGETLLLNSIQRSDMGAYLCIASNGIPPPVSKRFMVQVHCKYLTSNYYL